MKDVKKANASQTETTVVQLATFLGVAIHKPKLCWFAWQLLKGVAFHLELGFTNEQSNFSTNPWNRHMQRKKGTRWDPVVKTQFALARFRPDVTDEVADETKEETKKTSVGRAAKSRTL